MSASPASPARTPAVCAALNCCWNASLPLKLKTMLMTVNQHELGQMQAFARNLGVEFKFDPILNAGLDGSLLPTDLRLATG